MQVIECYLPLIRFLANTGNDDAGDYGHFRQQVEHYIAEATQACTSIVGNEELHAARFAITVWVDEWVLRSTLGVRHEWRDCLLQTQYYRTMIGGEVFFTRLDSLDEHSNKVRRVYLLCLLLGFQGKYRHLEHQQLQARIQQARRALPEAWWPEGSSAEITPGHAAGFTPRRRGGWLASYRYLVLLTATWAVIAAGLIFTFA